ncbi:MAG: endonuclease/exonuclease/phosphatase family protein [Flavobacteriales bacterium]|nr:endonuclease/exonuclease/phosphatase family protein [Flavobacteriales bacterium]
MRAFLFNLRFISWIYIVFYVLLLALPNFFVTITLKAFLFQVSLFGSVLAVWALIKSNVKLTLALFLVSSLGYFNIKSELDTSSNVTNREERIIAHFNVLKYNHNHLQLIKMAKETEADLISFQEVDDIWAGRLERLLQNEYPNNFSVPKGYCFGLAVFSKYPLSNCTAFDFEGLWNIKGSFSVDNRMYSFLTAHTRAPTSLKSLSKRNRHIKALAETENIEDVDFVVGDFNSVPWDDSIVNFKNRTRLIDSRKSLAPTYPSFFPFAKIPIDYIFYNSKHVCSNFEVIKNTSSDHSG